MITHRMATAITKSPHSYLTDPKLGSDVDSDGLNISNGLNAIFYCAGGMW